MWTKIKDNWKVYKSLLSKSKKVILLDAFTSMKTINHIQSIDPKSSLKIYKTNVYNNQRDVNDYVITTYGLDNNSILTNENIIRIYIDCRINYSNIRPSVDFGLEYKLTMNGNIELIPWTQANMGVISGTLKSYFDLDTSWLLTNQNYQISFRAQDLGSYKVLPEKIEFRVVNKFK